MRDERGQQMCCQFADDELLGQPELFDCATCPVAEHCDALDPENRAAWSLYQQMAKRFVVDVGIGAEVFRRLTEAEDAETVCDRVQRLAIIYDVLSPPPEPKRA